MDPTIVRDIDVNALLAHGVRSAIPRAPISARELRTGDVIVVSLSGKHAQLLIDTRAAHPDHAVFAILGGEQLWTKHGDEPWVEITDGLVVAAHGAQRELQANRPWRLLAVFMPRATLATFVASLAPRARLFTDRRMLDVAMESFLNGILSDDDLTASAIERYAVEQLVSEMCGALLLDRTGVTSGHGSPRTVLRERAVAVITQQCSNSDLTPTDVAREVQSSLRQLQHVFAEVGNSIAGEIRRQRSRLAQSLLLDSRYDVLSIEQVAHRAGFQSSMSLRRAIEATYRTTPSALRNERER